MFELEGNHNPLRYDLMRELPLETPGRPHASLFGKSTVRPKLGSLMDSLREKSKLRKPISRLPEPRRKLYSSYKPKLNNEVKLRFFLKHIIQIIFVCHCINTN